MPTFAGQMTQTPPGDPQWRACDGSYIRTFQPPRPPQTARPHTGVSTGTFADYERNVGTFAGSRGIGGWLIRLPYDKTGTWFISTADDSSETTIPGAPTPQHPPPGVT
jgi:hypothetical protein